MAKREFSSGGTNAENPEWTREALLVRSGEQNISFT